LAIFKDGVNNGLPVAEAGEESAPCCLAMKGSGADFSLRFEMTLSRESAWPIPLMKMAR